MFADQAMERLAAHGHPHPCAHVRYEGAGHAIRPPHAPTTAAWMTHPFAGRLPLGGAARPTTHADSWPKVLAFLGAEGRGRARN